MSTAAFSSAQSPAELGLTLERTALRYTLLPPSYPFFYFPVQFILLP